MNNLSKETTVTGQRIISTALFVFINTLFVYKYSSRITEFSLPLSLTYCVLLSVVSIIIWRAPDRIFKRSVLLSLVAVSLIVYISIFRMIKIEIVNVDRWNIITSFLDALFSGRFPYAARSFHNNIPGPFPVYFILAIPFYLIGEIGYYTLFGFLCFVYIVKKSYRDTKTGTILLILLSSSPAFLWEVSVRSTIFVNMVLFLLWVLWVEKTDLNRRRNFLLTGIAGGLMLSTRGILALPMAAYLSFKFLKDGQWLRMFRFGVLMISGFIITLLPFALWDFHLFMINNPLTLQAGSLPSVITASLIGLTILLGKNIDLRGCYLLSGIMLFSAVALSFVLRAASFGLRESFFNSRFDISYFIFALPFVLLSMPEKGYAPSHGRRTGVRRQDPNEIKYR